MRVRISIVMLWVWVTAFVPQSFAATIVAQIQDKVGNPVPNAVVYAIPVGQKCLWSSLARLRTWSKHSSSSSRLYRSFKRAQRCAFQTKIAPSII